MPTPAKVIMPLLRPSLTCWVTVCDTSCVSADSLQDFVYICLNTALPVDQFASFVLVKKCRFLLCNWNISLRGKERHISLKMGTWGKDSRSQGSSNILTTDLKSSGYLVFIDTHDWTNPHQVDSAKIAQPPQHEYASQAQAHLASLIQEAEPNPKFTFFNRSLMNSFCSSSVPVFNWSRL